MSAKMIPLAVVEEKRQAFLVRFQAVLRPLDEEIEGLERQLDDVKKLLDERRVQRESMEDQNAPLVALLEELAAAAVVPPKPRQERDHGPYAEMKKRRLAVARWISENGPIDFGKASEVGDLVGEDGRVGNLLNMDKAPWFAKNEDRNKGKTWTLTAEGRAELAAAGNAGEAPDEVGPPEVAEEIRQRRFVLLRLLKEEGPMSPAYVRRELGITEEAEKETVNSNWFRKSKDGLHAPTTAGLAALEANDRSEDETQED